MKMKICFLIRASAFRTLKDNYNDRYEYVLPDIVVDKNLFASQNMGLQILPLNVNVSTMIQQMHKNFYQ